MFVAECRSMMMCMRMSMDMCPALHTEKAARL